MGQFIDSIRVVKKNYSKYDSWEQSQADERAKKEYLAKTLNIPQDRIDLTSAKSQTVIRATEIMDRYSEDNCEDMEQATSMAAILPMMIIPLGGQVVVDAIKNDKASNVSKKVSVLKQKLQVQISKQAEDVPDLQLQIKNLERRIKNIHSKYPIYGLLVNVGLGLVIGSSFILWGNAKQKEASRIGRYQARQKDLKDIKNFVIYTPEQIKQAEEIVKSIPDEKNKSGLIKIFNELRAISKDKKAYKEYLKKKDPDIIEKLKMRTLTPDLQKAAKEDQELIVDTVKEINIKAEEYSENVENAFDTLGTLSWLIAIPVWWTINSILKLFKVPSKYRAAISIAIPTLTSLGLTTSGTLVQKEASRVGRYVARNELSSNPARLMAYSDEDMKKAKDVKAEKQRKSVLDKISNSFKFLKQYIKDSKEYNKYKKTVHQDQEKMQKAFSKLQISEEQKKKAESLQKKVFLAFDEIDEMSQRYSEDVEAGAEIAKTTMGQVWSLLSGGFVAFCALTFAKGKFPFSKVVNTLTNVGLKKDSSIRKSINELHKMLSSDKELMQKFNLSLADGDLDLFLKSKAGRILVPQINVLKRELKEVILKLNLRNPNSNQSILNSHLKQGAISKWVRNLFIQSIAMYGLKKAKIPIGDLSNYKTLIGTGIVAFVPVLGVIFSVPYLFNAWLTDIQKKAGKIGVMKAMEKLDDPRVFAD